MRFAYADPPYPGMAHMYKGHPDYAGEVDHKALVERLVVEYPDGWALSCHAENLRELLPLCPPDVRIGVWYKTFTAVKAVRVGHNWEPLIWWRGRGGTTTEVGDVFPYPMWVTGQDKFVGSKSAAFAMWLFRCLGALPGDTLDDLFPGSGAVGRAWETYQWQMTYLGRETVEEGAKVKLFGWGRGADRG